MLPESHLVSPLRLENREFSPSLLPIKLPPTSGLQWNTTSNIGRSSLASTVNLWNGGSSAAPAPAAGQSIQLTGDNPFSSENWTVGEPNLGTFREAPEPDAAPAISVQSDGDNLIINWQGGVPPYQLQSSNDLRDFTDLGEITTELTATVPITGDRQFFRVLSMAQPPQTARYRVTFSSLWSGLTFNSVPAEPTFGDLVGSTHNDQISFWSPGALASNGVAQLANTGSTLQLTSEVGLAIAGENADQIIVGPGIDQELGTSSFEITVNRDFPLLSLVSRLNDSPDWFTGVQNLDFLEDGLDFRDRIEVMLMPWDAGVDSGLGFGVPDSPTTPQASVQSLSDSASFLPSFFLGTDVGAIPLGGLIIERISEGE